jgi:hypothetical protein
MRLTFGELEALTCFRLTEFLALDNAGVTREKLLDLQWCAEVSIDLRQCAGDSEANRFGLAAVTTTYHVDFHIVLAQYIEFLEWSYNVSANVRQWEIFLVFPAVDLDLAGAIRYVYARYRSFASTDCIYCLHMIAWTKGFSN